MALPKDDHEYLAGKGFQFTVSEEGGMTCVVLKDFPLPAGLTRGASDLLLRLSPGFPDVKPDMWWFEPPVHRQNGQVINQTEHHEAHLGRTWQRWSRHLEDRQWQPGSDTLETYVAVIQRELERAVEVTG